MHVPPDLCLSHQMGTKRSENRRPVWLQCHRRPGVLSVKVVGELSQNQYRQGLGGDATKLRLRCHK